MTFVPHPSEVVRPGSHPPVLTTIVRRAELVEQLGVDVFCALPFTLEFSQLPPDEFVHLALVERLHAAGVVVGDNFRFGHKAAGDVARWCGWASASASPPKASVCCASGEHVRSARPMCAPASQAGDVAAAAEPWAARTASTASSSAATSAAATSGFPTANLRTEPWAAVPADGVYAGRVVRLDEWGRTLDEPPIGIAAISVGTNPTFEVRQRRVEAYVLDFDADLYGQSLGVEFLARLRGMERYQDVEALITQMRADVEQTRAALS